MAGPHYSCRAAVGADSQHPLLQAPQFHLPPRQPSVRASVESSSTPCDLLTVLSCARNGC